MTDKLHPNGSLVKIFPKDPYKWEKITLPFSNGVLMDAKVFENQILCNVVSVLKTTSIFMTTVVSIL